MKYRDIADVPEDERIAAIGKHAISTDGTTAFITDDEPGKPERYIAKLLNLFPELEVVRQGKGPVEGVVSVIVQKKTP